jgi:predicted NBD/HSP70 family sugar kinase
MPFSLKYIGGFSCPCGKTGCFEVHASAQGLVRHYLQQGGLAKNAAQVIALVKTGDAQAKVALKNYLNDLSTGLANLVTFYNPDTIALGGGLAQAEEIFENLQTLVLVVSKDCRKERSSR